MYTAPRGPVGIAMVVLLAIMALTVVLYESCGAAESSAAASRSAIAMPTLSMRLTVAGAP